PQDTGYPQQQQGYGNDYPQNTGYPQQQQGSVQQQAYNPQGYSPYASSQSSGQVEFALDTALIREQTINGQAMPTPMQDGELLRRAANDKFQIYLSPGFDMYLYVYAVDATGWIQRLYPDPTRGHRNPVRMRTTLTLPRPGFYFGLDDVPGNQEIWFLASRQPRLEVEQMLSQFSLDRKRPASGFATESGQPGFDQISVASVYSRGLVEIGPGTSTAMWNSTGASFEVTPARLFGQAGSGEMVFSRWFRAE
ncbi:MAG: DUF4384 domain-containing protein, partial [Deltaproteobacteria bacterium]|nr:DUF4384 domain-containing protein [Deltaproteobacteria bacterium]